MKFTKISLRDCFWLILIAAVGLSWGIERYKMLGRLHDLRRDERRGDGVWQDKSGIAPLLASIQQRSREELLAEIRSGPKAPLFDVYLLEAVRRGWTEELKAGYQEFMRPERAPPGSNAAWKKHPQEIENLEYLTALRRSEGKPDPLKVSIRSIGKDSKGKPVRFPYIFPQIENVDVDKAKINHWKGGGENYVNWKVILTNSQKETVDETSFFSPANYPRSPRSLAEIRNSKIMTGKDFYLDARSFLRPPPSGRYQLELVFSDREIAYRRDVSLRMVWKSDPIPVVVINRTHRSKWKLIVVPLSISTVAIAILAAAGFARYSKRLQLMRNDWIALAIIAVLAAGWALNAYSIRSEIERNTQDSNADWTMQLAE